MHIYWSQLPITLFQNCNCPLEDQFLQFTSHIVWCSQKPFTFHYSQVFQVRQTRTPSTSIIVVMDRPLLLTSISCLFSRFLFSTVRLTCVRATFSFLALLVAIAGPALLLAFQVYLCYTCCVRIVVLLLLLLLLFWNYCFCNCRARSSLCHSDCSYFFTSYNCQI